MRKRRCRDNIGELPTITSPPARPGFYNKWPAICDRTAVFRGGEIRPGASSGREEVRSPSFASNWGKWLCGDLRPRKVWRGGTWGILYENPVSEHIQLGGGPLPSSRLGKGRPGCVCVQPDICNGCNGHLQSSTSQTGCNGRLQRLEKVRQIGLREIGC